MCVGSRLPPTNCNVTRVFQRGPGMPESYGSKCALLHYKAISHKEGNQATLSLTGTKMQIASQHAVGAFSYTVRLLVILWLVLRRLASEVHARKR